ncbi:MAG: hypothetical protein WC861_05120 [Candidatus Micrarchaeia archaeon]
MKQKTMHQSPSRSFAIRATIFAVSAFFLAHAVFGKPALLKPAQAKQMPDSCYQAQGSTHLVPGAAYQTPTAIYATLSMESRQFLETLRNNVNTDGVLPQNAVMSMPAFIEIVVEWAPKLANNPRLAANFETAAKVMENLFKRSGIEVYQHKGQNMREIAAVLKALQAFPAEQKQLLSELSKTFVVPLAP